MKLVAFVVIPLQLVVFALAVALIDDPDVILGTTDFSGDYPTLDDQVEGLLWSMFAGVTGAVASARATIGCFRAIASAYLGGSPDWRDSLRRGVGDLPSLIWIGVIATVLLIPAFLLLIVPGIWLSVAWSVVVPVLLVEGVKGRRALGRSYRLVRGRWWATGAALGVAMLLILIAGFVLGLALLVVALTGGTDSVAVAALLSAVTNGAAAVVTTPLMATVVAVVYFDLRVRKEGLDLRALAAEMGAEDELDPSAALAPRPKPPPPSLPPAVPSAP